MPPLLTLRAPLILASQSPRRRALLEQVEWPFTVEVSPAEEQLPDDASPHAAVRAVAHQKATPVAHNHPDALTLAADTVVVFEQEILGKPDSPEAARALLQRMQDRRHHVLTGMALHHPATGRRVATVTQTTVFMAPLTDAEIDAYVRSELPMDKAGSYGIQDAIASLFVHRLHGDYYNVMGLPLRTLYATLRTNFSDLIADPA
ncbi:MAG: Maf family protein [Longimonas sp.]|uniref:Maf family protein n=1 Tax=Longimonas sp. TaxID=2039626 RepID=UPI0039751CE2